MNTHIHALLLLALMCTSCSRDPLDQRTPREAVVEIAAYTGIAVPGVEQIIGYRAGWEERFARLEIRRDALPELREHLAHCETTALPRWIDGADASGTERWWTPRDVPQAEVYECRLPSSPGMACVILDQSASESVTVYIYAFKP